MEIIEIAQAGWFPVKVIKGDLKNYAAGGIALPVKASRALNISITDGFTGYYNASTGKLMVYRGFKDEAEASDLQNETFEAVLML